MLVLNLPFKALMFLTLMRPSLVLFLVLWLKLVKDFLKVRCRLALLPFLISCLIWLDLVASLPLIKERILVIILLLHFLSLMLGSVLVLMLPLLVWLTPDLRIKKSLLKCNWTIRKRLPRCKKRLKKRWLALSWRLHARNKNQKKLTKTKLDNQKEIAEMQNETQKEIAGIQSATSRQNTKDQVYAQNEMLAYQQKESTARVASIMENTNLSKQQQVS